MKSLFAFIILFSFGMLNAQSVVPICAYPSVPAPTLTTIVWDTTTWDFGVIEQGIEVEHTFIFTNIGTEPLIIENVKGVSSCRTREFVKEPVKPGEKGWVKISFSPYMPGSFCKGIAIIANMESRVQMLYFKGEAVATPVFHSPTIDVVSEIPRVPR